MHPTETGDIRFCLMSELFQVMGYPISLEAQSNIWYSCRCSRGKQQPMARTRRSMMTQLGNGSHICAFCAGSILVAWKFLMLSSIVPDHSPLTDLRLTSAPVSCATIPPTDRNSSSAFSSSSAIRLALLFVCCSECDLQSRIIKLAHLEAIVSMFRTHAKMCWRDSLF